MTLEASVKALNLAPNTLHHLRLLKPDGRESKVVIEIEHDRLYLYRYAKPYANAASYGWDVYRWRDDEGDWVAHWPVGTARHDGVALAAAAEPITLALEH